MDPMKARNLLASWLAAVAALPLVMIAVVAGQGLGAALGGAAWIGVTLPLHLQPWALVNEPSPGFAASSAATGYWLGGLLLPAFIALTAVGFLPRPRTIAAELAVVQLTFAMAAGGLGWLPLVDPVEGHLARWLGLHQLPPVFLFVPAMVGCAAAVPAVFRLLAFQRAAHGAPGSWTRMGIVCLHLLPATLLWIGLGSAAAGTLPLLPALGVLLPLLTALPMAAVLAVPPWVLPLEPVQTRTFVLLGGLAVALGALVYVAGRPLPGSRASGLLWARPNAFNNVRPWVRPVELYRYTGPYRETPPPPLHKPSPRTGGPAPAGRHDGASTPGFRTP